MKSHKDILESGMLERYILDELTAAEVQRVESALENDPALKAHLYQMELDLEKMAGENAVHPPDHIKKSLFQELDKKPDTAVISLATKRTSLRLLGAAATVAVLFMLSSFWLYQKLNGIESDLQLVRDENRTLLEENTTLQKSYAESAKWLEVINSPKTEKLIMRGNLLSPEAEAISYVNHETRTVVLNTEGLPPLDAEKDYQLWADVEGEMINMGVVPEDSPMAMMAYIDKAESFNLTIEPAGGSDHPTVSNLISNVYLK